MSYNVSFIFIFKEFIWLPPPSFQTIPIVVAFDNNYCIPAGVSLYSMLSSCAQERDGVKLFYQIHCLVDSLSAENAEKLKRTMLV
ncbi:hypothetical protein KVE41_04525 [Helicobacter pylori]|nr:hypothetical protein KVE41_04525 [Helicobacter pylori]